MREKTTCCVQTGLFPVCDHYAKLFLISVDDDGGEQFQPFYVDVLALGGAVPDFTLPPDPKSTLQRMMRFARVQGSSWFFVDHFGDGVRKVVWLDAYALRLAAVNIGRGDDV